MNVTIVVAGDHQLIREGIRRLVESRAGVEVVGEAANGEDAERLILELRPHVALLDIGPSGLSGIEVTRRIRRAGVLTRVAVLTGREREVLRLVADGHSSKEIAELLGVSYKTVETHRTNLMDKVGIHKVSGLVRLAIRDGLVTP